MASGIDEVDTLTALSSESKDAFDKLITTVQKLVETVRKQNNDIQSLQQKMAQQSEILSVATAKFGRMEDSFEIFLACQDTILSDAKISESSPLSPNEPEEKELVKVLDQVEARVEILRKDAARIEEEKDTLLATLDAIKHSEWMGDLDEFEREDVHHSLARVQARCLTVDATVHTTRDQQQEEALNQVNQYIDSLVVGVKDDPLLAHSRCQACMNACSSQQLTSPSTVAVDVNFESAILGCTVDDQKKVKKRLQGLLNYFAGLNITST